MNYEGLTLPELRKRAKLLGVKNIPNYKKVHLIEVVKAIEETSNTPVIGEAANENAFDDAKTSDVKASKAKANETKANKAVDVKTNDTKAGDIKAGGIEAEVISADSGAKHGRVVKQKLGRRKKVSEPEIKFSVYNKSTDDVFPGQLTLDTIDNSLPNALKPVEALPEEEKAAKPLPEEEKVTEPLPEEEKAAEPLPEEEKVVEPLPEEEKAAEALPEEGKAAEPLLEEEKVAEALPEEGKATEPLLEEGKVSELLSEDEGQGGNISQEPEKFIVALEIPSEIIKPAAVIYGSQDTVKPPEYKRAPAYRAEYTDLGADGEGILEIMPEGYGFLRTNNYLQGPNDIYISPSQIRRFNLRPGDSVRGSLRSAKDNDKFNGILFVKAVNGDKPDSAYKRPVFEDLTPVFPDEKLHLEAAQNEPATRLIDLISPIGKGQRGMIVSPPKAGKTILLKKIAHSILINHPDVWLIILLIDERPEEVTDMQRSIVRSPNADVVYSTFDEQPEHHKKVAEIVLERAKRLVEQGKDVVVLLDSITRMSRAYNLTLPPGGRTLSGGLDPAALYIPKKFFGAARNIENGGSLTILATALVDTGSRLDDMVFEEFKGTGNMELVLDRRLSEKRIFPAIDINKSSTRREDLLLTTTELDALYALRRAMSNASTAELTEEITDMLLRTPSNKDFIQGLKALDKR